MNQHRLTSRLLQVGLGVLVALPLVGPSRAAVAQQQIDAKVPIAFNRFYDYDELAAEMAKLASAHPELCSLHTIGKSEQGREMWLLTINNPETGSDLSKPGMWIDGNVHGNEVQAGETVLYARRGTCSKATTKFPAIRELVDSPTSFYLLPFGQPGRPGGLVS